VAGPRPDEPINHDDLKGGDSMSLVIKAAIALALLLFTNKAK
jgi:hypothetical protein